MIKKVLDLASFSQRALRLLVVFLRRSEVVRVPHTPIWKRSQLNS